MRHSQAQLDWQASCYLLGELSPAEQAAFEADLALSQPAREALARAVELQQAACAALASTSAVEAPAGRLPGGSVRPAAREAGFSWAWAASSCLAVLALAAFAWFGGGLSFSSGVNDELAASWTELSRLAAEGDAVVAETVAYIPPAEPAQPVSVAVAEAELSEAGETPSWMTAAVFGLAGRPVAPDNRPEQAVDAAGPVEN